MNINKGFKINAPDVFVPWGIDGKQLIELFAQHSLKYITTTYYTANCISLNGLNCMIGFHFEKGCLAELEFFQSNYDDQKKSFDEFQEHFVKEFGEPTHTTEGNEGFNNYEWLFNGIRIIHLVYDRFGPEEHMRIKKIN
ncbi:hypothetical protein SAMN05216490_4359 [Mucilaginibacter mallensis]|uniref:Uncharacterized protein n=1 Tax=Mucilaginibacter mallensis TaxID=652787 RepID=A0A1H2BTT7_MUCMA|nr:hypothetical protein [Mucilaginibacter mallensis]SDT61760.1 hypothetical protein SAMN05216490_4359 [Mucilaginibacter mallensis]